MAALDTNVLVRHLVQDDPAQSALATRLVRRCIMDGRPLHIPVSVMLELEWVLRTRYGFGKPEVVQVLVQLLSAAELAVADEGAVERALQRYRQANADFADCVHVALAELAGQLPLWTFDRKAAKLGGARPLA